MTVTVGMVSAVVALLMNFGALVWGAATIRSSVAHLEDTLEKVGDAVTKMGDRIASHDTRITVLENTK